MSKKNEFTYDGGSMYIDWLCYSNKLVLLRDSHIISGEDRTSVARALKCKTGDILCLVLGQNISYFGYSKLIEDMGGTDNGKYRKIREPGIFFRLLDWRQESGYHITHYFHSLERT